MQLQQTAAIEHKTSHAMERYAVIGCRLKQNANEGCNSCAAVVQVLYVLLQLLVIAAIILSFKFYCKFYCMFYFTCDRSLKVKTYKRRLSQLR